MIRTLLPALLLGFAGQAAAQEIDETTSSLHLEAVDAAAPGARERGSARSSSSRGASVQTSTRSNGSRSVSRTTQSNGDRSRSKTTGSVSRSGSAPGHVYGGEKSRSVSTWSNGRSTVTKSSGDKWSADAHRQNGANGGQRTVGQVEEKHRDSWRMEGPNGNVAGRTTTSQSSHTRGVSSTGNGFDHRSAGVRTEGRTTGSHAPSRPAAIPAHGRSPGAVAHAPGRPVTPGRLGSTPPRAGHGPGDVRGPVHGSPRGPGHVVVHDRGPTRVATSHVVHHRHVTYTHVRPYHGVFVYGPRPVTHVHYVDDGGPVRVRKADLPERAIDREDTLAVGIRGGSLWSGYVGANGYADIGAGLAARYRPDEAVGLELAVMHHDQTWTIESERSQTQVAGSVELFAWPWTRVSPYVLGGVTYTARDIQDEIYQYDAVTTVDTGAPLVGPHLGAGLELALGKSIALDLEARYVGYLNRMATDASYPGALSTTAAVMVHF